MSSQGEHELGDSGSVIPGWVKSYIGENDLSIGVPYILNPEKLSDWLDIENQSTHAESTLYIPDGYDCGVYLPTEIDPITSSRIWTKLGEIVDIGVCCDVYSLEPEDWKTFSNSIFYVQYFSVLAIKYAMDSLLPMVNQGKDNIQLTEYMENFTKIYAEKMREIYCDILVTQQHMLDTPQEAKEEVARNVSDILLFTRIVKNNLSQFCDKDLLGTFGTILLKHISDREAAFSLLCSIGDYYGTTP